MKSTQGVTIIIPSIGRPSLSPLLHSIHQDRSLAHHETLIVVDSALIKTLIKQYSAYKCIKFIPQDINNISMSRNMGIALANHELITLIDDDDLWVDGRVRTFRYFLSTNSNSIIFGSTEFINTKTGRTKKLGKYQQIKLNDFIKQFQTFYTAREKYFLHVGSCAFLRNTQIPTFSDKLIYSEDQIWILESLVRGLKILQTSEVTLKYFFSRDRSNNRWNIETEKEIYESLSSLDINLARKYINRKSLKSIAISGDKVRFFDARISIQNGYEANILSLFSILFYSLVVQLSALFKKY